MSQGAVVKKSTKPALYQAILPPPGGPAWRVGRFCIPSLLLGHRASAGQVVRSAVPCPVWKRGWQLGDRVGAGTGRNGDSARDWSESWSFLGRACMAASTVGVGGPCLPPRWASVLPPVDSLLAECSPSLLLPSLTNCTRKHFPSSHWLVTHSPACLVFPVGPETAGCRGN